MESEFGQSKHHYTLFIDEAGDDKVERLKPDDPNGNSEWLCLGGYLVRAEVEPDLGPRRDAIRVAIGGKPGEVLHYRDLKPKNRAIAVRLLANKRSPARGFVVCSFKKTMDGYRNARAAAVMGESKDTLYNYVCRLLLERVTVFVARDAKERGISKPALQIVMASRKGHHFGAFKAYIHKLVHQATAGSTFQDIRLIEASVLRLPLIKRAPASQVPGLQLADTLVSAFFQSIEQLSPNYADKTAKHLSALMARKELSYGHGRTWNHEGVTLYPATDASKLLTPEQSDFFGSFGYDMQHLKTARPKKIPQKFTQEQRLWSNTRVEGDMPTKLGRR